MGSTPFQVTEPACKKERSGRRVRRLRVGMIGESVMLRHIGLLLGTAAALAVAAPAFGQDDDDPALVNHEHRATERLNRAQLEYGVMPKPNPHRRWNWDP